jgi:hypothetical protein
MKWGGNWGRCRGRSGEFADREGDAVGSEGGTGNEGEPRNVQGDTGGSDGGTYREIHRDLGEVEEIGGQCRRIRGIRWKHREKKNILQKILVINHSGKIDMYCIF